ncbi:MAG TPA: 4Fe-4S dicluster domain-containing protein [Candidatus Hydrogenedentes bacterium]|nr:4Fe-4S dicluster domain-containing protein [Candidatus Hydrogenedentota bacterium]
MTTPSGKKGPAMDPTLQRRSFLKAGIGTMAALASLAGVTAPLRSLESGVSMDAFLQQHYKRLTPEALDQILQRIENEIARDYGAKVTVGNAKPMDGVEFGYALNLTRCNGNRKCVEACVQENNQTRDPEMQYIRVLEMPSGSLDVEKSDLYFDHDQVPAKEKYYLPVQCQQCQNPPCTKVCPVEATWTEPDGITVIDYNWCIGCRYCMAACPYEARRFNWSKAQIAPEEINPNMGYLSNRIRPAGVVEKCTYCLHRTREGKYPACMEVCPTGARVFGNMLDPDSEINYILKNKRVYLLKEDAGTVPRFFYYFDA